jgi:hypothetical protein
MKKYTLTEELKLIEEILRFLCNIFANGIEWKQNVFIDEQGIRIKRFTFGIFNLLFWRF